LIARRKTMTITTTEIRETFERLSRIDWSDYCELCAREHDEWAHCESERGADVEEDERLPEWSEILPIGLDFGSTYVEDAVDAESDWADQFWAVRADGWED
jgi:hypothetical protein